MVEVKRRKKGAVKRKTPLKKTKQKGKEKKDAATKTDIRKTQVGNDTGVFAAGETEAAPQKKQSRRMPSVTKMERDVRFVLMDLMTSSASDAVRVAAAKALMDKVNKEQGDETDEQERRSKERDDALAEAGRLLAELATLKSFGARHKAKVA